MKKSIKPGPWRYPPHRVGNKSLLVSPCEIKPRKNLKWMVTSGKEANQWNVLIIVNTKFNIANHCLFRGIPSVCDRMNSSSSGFFHFSNPKKKQEENESKKKQDQEFEFKKKKKKISIWKKGWKESKTKFNFQFLLSFPLAHFC